jgi:hypothetical protein
LAVPQHSSLIPRVACATCSLITTRSLALRSTLLLVRERTNYTVLYSFATTQPCAGPADLTPARSTVTERPRPDDDWHTDKSHRRRAEPTWAAHEGGRQLGTGTWWPPAARGRCVLGTNRGGALESEAACRRTWQRHRHYMDVATTKRRAIPQLHAHARTDACTCPFSLRGSLSRSLPCSTLCVTPRPPPARTTLHRAPSNESRLRAHRTR